MKLYRKIASCLNAMENCGTNELGRFWIWHDRHETEAVQLVYNHMPSGSGIDCGTHIDLDRSTGEKLVFTCGFHHINQDGMYDGWTEHTVTVRPSLQFGIDIEISGRNRNDIKEYLHEVFYDALIQEVQ
jgi:hypothetical protein